MGAQTVSRIQRHKELDTRTRDFIIKETDRVQQDAPDNPAAFEIIMLN